MEPSMAYRRKVVTLMIGTNHCHDPRNYIRPDKAEDVLIGIREVVQEIRNRLPKFQATSLFRLSSGTRKHQ